MSRVVATLLAVAWISLAAGCSKVQFKGERDRAAMAALEASSWPFVPVMLRVHPFTTLRPPGGGEGVAAAAVLEARIELLDQQGDVTKGIGDWRFELYETGERASEAGQDRQAYVWTVAMKTPDDSRRHYDPITRTYGFNLKLDEAPPAERKLELRIQFTDPAGNRLTTQGLLEYKPAAMP